VLTIRDGKGGKDRQVPVSAPLRERLARYHAQIAGRTGGDWFFPGRKGLPLTLMNVNRNFRRFLWQARIPHGGRGHGPRVHDLRHWADGWVMRPAVAFPLLGAAELGL
jgi:integrase